MTADPKMREPPHCQTCACGMPREFAITSIMDLACDNCGKALGKHIGTSCPADDVGAPK